MKKIYSARDPIDAEFVKSVFSRAGLNVTIRGSLLWGARGELPMSADSSPSIWVEERDFEEAAKLLSEWEQTQAPAGETWKCAACGESNERQFLECWQCGANGEDQPTLTSAESTAEDQQGRIGPENSPEASSSPLMRPDGRLIITTFIPMLSILIYGYLRSNSYSKVWSFLDSLGFVSADEIWSGKYWALLPISFVHYSFWIIAFSLSWFWFLARRIELRHGHGLLAMIILFSALTTQGASLFVHSTLVPGLIGVVCALLGFAWAAGDLKGDAGRPQFVSSFFLISVIFVIYPAEVAATEIFNASYLCAFISGISLAQIFVHKKWRGPSIAWTTIVLAGTILSLFWMPWSVQWLAYKSNEQLSIGNIDRALMFADSAVERDPLSVAALFARGRARIESFDLDIAMASFQTAYSLDKEAASSAYVEQGIVLNLLHQYERAVNKLDYAIEKDKYYPLAYSVRGWSRLFLSEFDGAKQDFTSAIKLEPEGGEAYLGRGLAAIETYELASAAKDLKKSIELSSESESVQSGVSYLFLRDYNKALEDLNRAKKVGVFNPWLLSNTGWVHVEMNALDKATESFNEVLKRDPRNDHALLGLGLAQFKAGSLDLALNSINAAIETNPRYAKAYLHRGIVSLKRGDAGAAKQDFDKVIELNVRDAQAYFYRAVSLLALGDESAAELDRKKAVMLDSSLSSRSLTEP